MGRSWTEGASAPRPGWLDPPFLARPWQWIDTDRLLTVQNTTLEARFNTDRRVPSGHRAELVSVRALVWPANFQTATILPVNVRAMVRVRRNQIDVPGAFFEAQRMLVGRYVGAEGAIAGICCSIPQLHEMQAPIHLVENDTLDVRLTITAAALSLVRVCTALSGWIYYRPHEEPGEPGTVVR